MDIYASSESLNITRKRQPMELTELRQTILVKDEKSTCPNDVTSSDIYTPRQRTCLTICIPLAFCVEIMIRFLLGPTILHMAYLLKCDIALISLAFTFEWCGFLIGCLIFSKIYPKLNENFQFWFATFLMGISTIICPWSPNTAAFFVIKILQFVSLGYNDVMCHTTILKIWKGHKRQAVIYQTFAMLSPLGSFLAPLIVAPFLINLDQSSAELNLIVSSNVSAEYFKQNVNSTFHANINAAPANYELGESYNNYNSKNSSTSLDNTEINMVTYSEVAQVRHGYTIIGLLSVLLSIAFGISFLSNKQHYMFHHNYDTTSASNKKRQGKKLFIVCMSVIGFATGFVIFHSWIAPMAVEYLGWEPRDASYLASAYWFGMLIGRLLAIALVIKISARNLLALQIFGTVLTVLLAYFTVLYMEQLLWACTPLVGFTVSSTYTQFMLWTSEQTTLSSRVTSFIISCTAIGYMSTGLMTGYLFQTYTPLWVLYLSFIASLVQVIGFCSALFTVKFVYKSSSENETDL